MNGLDYILLAVLAGFMIYGYVKGFFRQALVIVGVAVAFFLAAKYHTNLAESPYLSGMRERSETVALVSSFVGIFFVTAAVASMLASLIGRKIRSWSLGAGDRWLGALLGIGIGVLLLGGLAVGLKEWQFPNGAVGSAVSEDVQEKAKGLVSNSVLIPHLADGCLYLVSLIPQESREELSEIYEQRIKIFGSTGVGGTSSGQAAGGGSNLTSPLTSSLQDPKTTAGQEQPTRSRKLLNLGAQRRLTLKYADETSRDATPVPASGKAESGAPTPAVSK